MTTEIETNRELPILEVGKWFVITLNKYQRKEFNIEEMRKNEWVKFDPDFVEFRTSDEIEEISIDIVPVNRDKKLIP